MPITVRQPRPLVGGGIEGVDLRSVDRAEVAATLDFIARRGGG